MAGSLVVNALILVQAMIVVVVGPGVVVGLVVVAPPPVQLEQSSVPQPGCIAHDPVPSQAIQLRYCPGGQPLPPTSVVVVAAEHPVHSHLQRSQPVQKPGDPPHVRQNIPAQGTHPPPKNPVHAEQSLVPL